MRLLSWLARVTATAMILVAGGCWSPGTCSKNVHIVTSAGKAPGGMWVPPSEDVYVVGGAGLTERNTTVLQVAGGANFESVWGSSPNDVYAVGDGGVFHWDGGARWTNQVPTGHDFRAVRGADARHVWAAGAPDIRSDVGSLLFSTGDGNWSSIAIATIPFMTNLWVQSSDDVFAVGASGTVAHLTGGAWRVESIGMAKAVLTAAWSSSATDVYVVGYDAAGGIVAHSAGDGSWATTRVGASYLEAVWGTSSSDVFAAGSYGSPANGCALLHFDGSSWTSQGSAPCTYGIVDGVSVDPQQMIVLQADGKVSSRTGLVWTQYDATIPGSAYDTTLTANRLGFDGKCPL
jgi:hypothetical protein